MEHAASERMVGYAADDTYQQVTGGKLELLTGSAVTVGVQGAFEDADGMRRRLP